MLAIDDNAPVMKRNKRQKFVETAIGHKNTLSSLVALCQKGRWKKFI